MDDERHVSQHRDAKQDPRVHEHAIFSWRGASLMSLTPNEMNEIVRRVAEQMRPVTKRLDAHSGEMKAVRAEIREEVSPAVLKRMSDSQQEINDRSTGFERLVLDSIAASRKETSELRDLMKTSLPPAATAAKGAELAAVAGAQASQRTEGKTDAVQVAADRADQNSLASKVAANRAVILIVLGMLFEAGWKAYQAMAHTVTP
ncbi:MAG: hypothetical protein M3Y26_00380 [Actinomycetota bacterium]|nr:hypothetical protein [Actinomycetota bacterium]